MPKRNKFDKGGIMEIRVLAPKPLEEIQGCVHR